MSSGKKRGLKGCSGKPKQNNNEDGMGGTDFGKKLTRAIEESIFEEQDRIDSATRDIQGHNPGFERRKVNNRPSSWYKDGVERRSTKQPRAEEPGNSSTVNQEFTMDSSNTNANGNTNGTEQAQQQQAEQPGFLKKHKNTIITVSAVIGACIGTALGMSWRAKRNASQAATDHTAAM